MKRKISQDEFTKVQIAELAEKVEKLDKRLKKDEKLGVTDGKEGRVKREPSEYNRFIAEHVNEMKGSTSQQRFAETVKLWKEKKDGKKRNTHKEEAERKEERKERRAKSKRKKNIQIINCQYLYLDLQRSRSRWW